MTLHASPTLDIHESEIDRNPYKPEVRIQKSGCSPISKEKDFMHTQLRANAHTMSYRCLQSKGSQEPS